MCALHDRTNMLQVLMTNTNHGSDNKGAIRLKCLQTGFAPFHTGAVCVSPSESFSTLCALLKIIITIIITIFVASSEMDD